MNVWEVKQKQRLTNINRTSHSVGQVENPLPSDSFLPSDITSYNLFELASHYGDESERHASEILSQ
jgi:hypothetical protein